MYLDWKQWMRQTGCLSADNATWMWRLLSADGIHSSQDTAHTTTVFSKSQVYGDI